MKSSPRPLAASMKGALVVVRSAGRSMSAYRGKNRTAALPQPDPRISIALAESPQHHLVPVLEEPSRFPAGELDGLAPAPGQLEQTSARVGGRARHRAAREDVTGTQAAAVARVVRHHLG